MRWQFKKDALILQPAVMKIADSSGTSNKLFTCTHCKQACNLHDKPSKNLEKKDVFVCSVIDYSIITRAGLPNLGEAAKRAISKIISPSPVCQKRAEHEPETFCCYISKHCNFALKRWGTRFPSLWTSWGSGC